MEVRTREDAEPAPVPPGLTNGRTNVPVTVPVMLPAVSLNENVYKESALAGDVKKTHATINA
jgi:hypothetical protein